jgi:2-polyprenyl-6-methoxyphenol hydroxylase-like FAD-dependent oxidoreductase
MAGIGIVGAGVAGLHLGLFLQQHGVPSTIYSDKTLEQLAQGRLLNTVVHHHCTRVRERALGINHWDTPDFGSFCHHHYVGGPQPLVFRGDFVQPSLAVDYRIYMPRLMEDYTARGGRLVIGSLQAADIERLAADHDLIVVAAGRGSFGDLFPRADEHSPFDRPQRMLCAGLFQGVTYPDPLGVTLSLSPGHGELIEIPIYSFVGRTTALLFENIPGGDLEVLAHTPYADDPHAFEQLVLDKLRQHHPTTYARVNPQEFGLARPLDLLQGAVTPTVRRSTARLANGKFAIAIGDARAVVDPVVGQGANAASHSAWILGELILQQQPFDEQFCQRAEQQIWEVVEAVSAWTNFMLQPPAPHLIELIVAMAQNKAVADVFTDNFNYPERQWRILSTPDRTSAFLREFDAQPVA